MFPEDLINRTYSLLNLSLIHILHRFIRHRVAEEAGCETVKCQISVANYFRGRLNASAAAMRGNQLYNDRVFDDILMSEGVNTHYLPLRNVQGRREERGVDVWLALEAYELVLSGTIDIIVLIVSDTDYTPLMRKIRAAGIPIMLLSWEFEYLTDDGIKMVTKTSHELLSLATYPIAMHEEIERGLEQNNPVVRNLFVCNEGCPPETEHTVEVSEILSLKSCLLYTSLCAALPNMPNAIGCYIRTPWWISFVRQ